MPNTSAPAASIVGHQSLITSSGLSAKVDDLADHLGNSGGAWVCMRGGRAQRPDLCLGACDFRLERRRLLGEGLVGVRLQKLGLPLCEFGHALATVWPDLAALLVARADCLVDSALRCSDTFGDNRCKVRHFAARLAGGTQVSLQCRSPRDRGPTRVDIAVAQ